MKSASVDKLFFILFGVFLLVIVGVAVVMAYTSPGAEAEMTTYAVSDKDKPKVSVDTPSFDFGQVKVEDTKVEEIKIRNEGTKPLEMNNFSTSCDCTFAQVIIDGRESPEFSMHGNSSWKGAIDPGKEAILKAIYKPSVMPVKGKVDRVIYFKTNDPEKTDVSIHFTAEVI